MKTIVFKMKIRPGGVRRGGREGGEEAAHGQRAAPRRPAVALRAQEGRATAQGVLVERKLKTFRTARFCEQCPVSYVLLL